MIMQRYEKISEAFRSILPNNGHLDDSVTSPLVAYQNILWATHKTCLSKRFSFTDNYFPFILKQRSTSISIINNVPYQHPYSEDQMFK